MSFHKHDGSSKATNNINHIFTSLELTNIFTLHEPLLTLFQDYIVFDAVFTWLWLYVRKSESRVIYCLSTLTWDKWIFNGLSSNLRKMCALDCGATNFMNEQIQFLDSLMDKRLSFALKRCRFQSRSVSFFLLSVLLVFNLAYIYSTK